MAIIDKHMMMPNDMKHASPDESVFLSFSLRLVWHTIIMIMMNMTTRPLVMIADA